MPHKNKDERRVRRLAYYRARYLMRREEALAKTAERRRVAGVSMMRRNDAGLTMEYIFARCVPEPNTGCWLWLGCTNARGYARIKYQKRLRQGTHLVVLLSRGEVVPDGMLVMHRCDQPSCLNPDHLLIGTKLENAQDMVKKGRHVAPRGRAKLSFEIADLIRSSTLSTAQLVAKFGVGTTAINDIRAGRSWVRS